MKFLKMLFVYFSLVFVLASCSDNFDEEIYEEAKKQKPNKVHKTVVQHKPNLIEQQQEAERVYQEELRVYEEELRVYEEELRVYEEELRVYEAEQEELRIYEAEQEAERVEQDRKYKEYLETDRIAKQEAENEKIEAERRASRIQAARVEMANANIARVNKIIEAQREEKRLADQEAERIAKKPMTWFEAEKLHAEINANDTQLKREQAEYQKWEENGGAWSIYAPTVINHTKVAENERIKSSEIERKANLTPEERTKEASDKLQKLSDEWWGGLGWE